MASREQKIEIRGRFRNHRRDARPARRARARRALRARLGRQPAAVPGARAGDRRTRLRLPDVRPAAGMPAPSRKRETVSRESNLYDLLSAYDALARASFRRQLGDRPRRQQLRRLPRDDPDVDAAGVVARAARSSALHRHRLGASRSCSCTRTRTCAAYRRSFVAAATNRALARVRGVQGRRAAGRVGARRPHSARGHQELSRRVHAGPLAHLPLHRRCRPRPVGRDAASASTPATWCSGSRRCFPMRAAIAALPLRPRPRPGKRRPSSRSTRWSRKHRRRRREPAPSLSAARRRPPPSQSPPDAARPPSARRASRLPSRRRRALRTPAGIR